MLEIKTTEINSTQTEDANIKKTITHEEFELLKDDARAAVAKTDSLMKNLVAAADAYDAAGSETKDEAYAHAMEVNNQYEAAQTEAAAAYTRLEPHLTPQDYGMEERKAKNKM